MQFDLGLEGLGYLVGMSLVFGIGAQVVAWRWATHWLWLVGAVAYFAGGLFFSEVLFASATINDIQPMIDGLAFDESMLGGLIVGIPVVAVTWYVTRRNRLRQPTSS